MILIEFSENSFQARHWLNMQNGEMSPATENFSLLCIGVMLTMTSIMHMVIHLTVDRFV